MTALKYDNEKSRMSLLPFRALRAVADVSTFGAKKYAPHNWRKGMDWSRLEDAMLRHYTDYQSGIDLDHESGLPSLAHMAWNALSLLEYYLTGGGADTRYQSEPIVSLTPRSEDLATNEEVARATAYKVYDKQGWLVAKVTGFELASSIAKNIGGTLQPSNLCEFVEQSTLIVKEYQP